MNATNPFQVPSCFQIDHERRRRERFKTTFIAVVAMGILLMIGLLIEGCMSQHARAASPASTAADTPELPSNPPAVAAELKEVSIPQPYSQPVVSQSAPSVSKVNSPPAGHSATIYVVKAGDTLTRIAKAHGTTVKNLEAVNGLDDDHISVGIKLKMPSA